MKLSPWKGTDVVHLSKFLLFDAIYLAFDDVLCGENCDIIYKHLSGVLY